MFHFGDAASSAQLIKTNAFNTKGPNVPDKPFAEMSEQEIGITLAYLSLSVKMARKMDAAEEVVALLVKDYDEGFKALAGACEEFRERVRNGVVFPVDGFTKENVKKYAQLAGVDSSES